MPGDNELRSAANADEAGNEPACREFVAYKLRRGAPPIIPASPKRAWMDATPVRFAYRCLPMVIANQAGWFILNPYPVRLLWTGSQDTAGVKIEFTGARPDKIDILSHFGCGIVTWRIPLVFRTPPGYNLLVRGPANYPKRSIYPLEGIVETDWSVATFTMNWKLLDPDIVIDFGEGEPICMIVPQRRGELEEFAPAITPAGEDEALAAQITKWANERVEFMTTPDRATQWHKGYFKGHTADATATHGHQTRLSIKPFTATGTDRLLKVVHEGMDFGLKDA